MLAKVINAFWFSCFLVLVTGCGAPGNGSEKISAQSPQTSERGINPSKNGQTGPLFLNGGDNFDITKPPPITQLFFSAHEGATPSAPAGSCVTLALFSALPLRPDQPLALNYPLSVALLQSSKGTFFLGSECSGGAITGLVIPPSERLIYLSYRSVPQTVAAVAITALATDARVAPFSLPGALTLHFSLPPTVTHTLPPSQALSASSVQLLVDPLPGTRPIHLCPDPRNLLSVSACGRVIGHLYVEPIPGTVPALFTFNNSCGVSTFVHKRPGAPNSVLLGYSPAVIEGQPSGLVLCSDRQLKKEFRPLVGSLDRIAALRPLHYKFRTEQFPNLNLPREEQTGLIAQEVEKLFPNLVITGEDGIKRIKYGPEFQVLTIAAVKQLKAQIEDLKEENIRVKQNSKAMASQLREIKLLLCRERTDSKLCGLELSLTNGTR